MPDWKMVYHPGGERIVFWTVSVPGCGVSAIILGAAVVLSVRRWRELRWFPLLGLWVYHLVALLLFGAAVAWVDINVTGVFI